MRFYEINVCQVLIFRHYTVYNKHVMIKIANETREKSSNDATDCTDLSLLIPFSSSFYRKRRKYYHNWETVKTFVSFLFVKIILIGSPLHKMSS